VDILIKDFRDRVEANIYLEENIEHRTTNIEHTVEGDNGGALPRRRYGKLKWPLQERAVFSEISVNFLLKILEPRNTPICERGRGKSGNAIQKRAYFPLFRVFSHSFFKDESDGGAYGTTTKLHGPRMLFRHAATAKWSRLVALSRSSFEIKNTRIQSSWRGNPF
jgi:hypothetical protein